MSKRYYNPEKAAAYTARKAKSDRERFIRAFDKTLIDMWTERQMFLFGLPTRRFPRRSGNLIRSTVALPFKSDQDYIQVQFHQKFLGYGIYVDVGTGREIPRGNPGDIGRDKVRKPKPWFNRKYYLSVMNLREFYAENLGLQTIDIIAQQLDDKALRRSVT